MGPRGLGALPEPELAPPAAGLEVPPEALAGLEELDAPPEGGFAPAAAELPLGEAPDEEPDPAGGGFAFAAPEGDELAPPLGELPAGALAPAAPEEPPAGGAPAAGALVPAEPAAPLPAPPAGLFSH